ncbi:MAG: glycoside hydrolase family 43 protein [Chitinispirillaceae bacterium]|nr:glycoside hydrolase family 43 protein [Chitinispirillaceae bacterium]
MKMSAGILEKSLFAVALTGILGIGYAQVDTTSEHYFLYTYFYNAEQDSGFRMAVSSDGVNWVKINDEKPIFAPTAGVEKLARDPGMWFDPATGVFHLVWQTGWNENGIGYATSKDLTTWSDQRYLPVGEKIPNSQCCWGPEIFYDDINDSIMVYWSTDFGEGGKRSFYVMTRDFVTFSDPVKLFDPGYTEIDASIIKYSEGMYYLFFKDEREPALAGKRSKNIHYVYGPTPQGPWWVGPWDGASEPITNPGCEGPSPIMIGDELRVYFDFYVNPSSTYGMVTVTGDPASVTEFPWTEGDTMKLKEEPFCPSSGSVIEIPRGYIMSLLYGAPLPSIADNAVIRDNSRFRQLSIARRENVKAYNLLGRNVAVRRNSNNAASVNRRMFQTAPGVLLVKPAESGSQSILTIKAERP